MYCYFSHHMVRMIGQNDNNPYAPAVLPKSPFVDLMSRISIAIDTWFCGLFRRKNNETVRYKTPDGSYALLCDV